MKAPARRCRFCGCTPEDPCKLACGDECGWVTERADRCNAPDCMKAFEAERRRLIREDAERQRLQREAKEQIRAARRKRWRKAA